jgi:hypothetical protein
LSEWGAAIRLDAIRNEAIPALIPVVIAYLVFLLLIRIVWWGAVTDVRTVGVMAVLMAGTLSFRTHRYSELPSFIGAFIRVLGFAIFVQAVFDIFNFSPASPNIFNFFAPPSTHIPVDRFPAAAAAFLGLVAGAVAIARPAFIIPSICYYIMFRKSLEWRTGIEIVGTDYEGMAEICLFGAIGVVLMMTRFHDKLIKSTTDRLKTVNAVDTQRLRTISHTLLWSVMVGAHLRSYLASAVAKFRAGQDEPFTWLLHNNTANSILIGLERGDNPLSRFPWLLQSLWDAIVMAGPFLNGAVLFGQLFAPLGAFHRRILIGLALFYDFFHIGVYFTLGALFFFWIVVNTMVVITVQRLPGRGITPLMTVTMLVTLFLSNETFYTNHLGWLDSAKLASTEFLVKTRDGRVVKAPGPFYGIYSYNIAQNKLFVPPGAFSMRLGGNQKNLADWRDARACGPKLNDRPTWAPFSSVVMLVRSTDEFARRHPWYKSWNTYYYYPHHMVPNPFEFGEFNALKMNDIVAYTYRVDSVCLSIKEGRLQRDVRHRWEATFPVGSGPVVMGPARIVP